MLFFLNRTWVLRGNNEPSKLLASDVNFSLNVDGVKYVELLNLRGRKNGNLSLTNTSFSIGYENQIQEDPKNEFCIYKLMSFYSKNHLPLGHRGPFLCKKLVRKF